MRKHSILYKTLCRALSLKRPHGGEGASLFTAWLCDRVPEQFELSIDAAGNVHIDARTSTKHRTLFVAHVDTVHREDGPNKFIKAHGTWYANGAPLGTDDGAGCAILMHLLYNNVPGYYIFTQGEECGGIGAKHLADEHASLLKQFDRAIAFDRRGIDSVITHQGFGRCCSDAFADALSDALNADMTLMYLPDNTGVYTDTAEFTDIIPECTNISVGYNYEHSDKEQIDIHHFTALAQRVINMDWDALPTDRDPTVVEPDYFSSYPSSAYSGTTSVSSSYASGAYSSYAYPLSEDEEREELQDAIYDAMAGYPGFLIELMCESVYPEDPEFAQRFVDKTRLRSQEMLKQASEWAKLLEPNVAMATLFDAVYREHA